MKPRTKYILIGVGLLAAGLSGEYTIAALGSYVGMLFAWAFGQLAHDYAFLNERVDQLQKLLTDRETGRREINPAETRREDSGGINISSRICHTANRLTTAIVDELDFRNVIYMEVTLPGGMGNAGGTVAEVLEGNSLIRYETDITSDAAAWNAAFEKVRVNASLFDYHYGGAGNQAYLRKGIGLSVDEQGERFILEHDGGKHFFKSSVPGVFSGVSSSIRNAAESVTRR